MTYWNYRVVKRVLPNSAPYYELREAYYKVVKRPKHNADCFPDVADAYYDSVEELEGLTTEAVRFGGDSVEELRDSLEMALRAFDKPVVEEKG